MKNFAKNFEMARSRSRFPRNRGFFGLNTLAYAGSQAIRSRFGKKRKGRYPNGGNPAGTNKRRKIANATSGSWTITKTKTKKKVSEEKMPDAVGVGFKKLVVNKPPKKLRVVKGVNIQFRRVVQGLNQGAAGQQLNCVIGCIGSTSQWMTTSANIANPALSVSECAYFQLNPNDKTTGSLVLAANTPANDQLFLKSADSTLEVTNFGTEPAEISIMWVKAKTNSEIQTPLDHWSQLLTTGRQTGDNVQDAANVGGTVAGSFGNMTSTVVGSLPTQVKEFRRMWKVLGTQRCNLSANATHRFNTRLQYNYLGKEAEMIACNPNMTNNPTSWTLANTTVLNVKNSTVWCMLFAHGAPIVDTTSNPHLVTYSGTDIGFIHNINHKFQTVYGNAGRVAQQTAYVAVPAGAASTVQKFPQEFTNTLVNLQQQT